MKKILIINGVRPQFIKTKALVFGFQKYFSEGVSRLFEVYDTMQHYDDVLRYDASCYNVIFHRSNQAIGSNKFGLAIDELSYFLEYHHNKYSSVIVFGDATPALVGAVASTRYGLPIIHIEAGARRDFFEVEDTNSRMVDSVSSIAACVTEDHKKNLEKEGFRGVAFHAGDLAYDYFCHLRELALPLPCSLPDNKYVLVTIHRPVNSNVSVLKRIIDSLKRIGHYIVWVTHPRTAGMVKEIIPKDFGVVLESQSHDSIISLLKNCLFLVSDSGGLIREAHLLSKYVIVPQTNGGWPELIENKLVFRSLSVDDIDAEILKVNKLLKLPYPDVYNSPFVVRDAVKRFGMILSDMDFLKGISFKEDV